MSEEAEILYFTIDETQAGQRLDKALAAMSHEYSRARMQSFINDGAVQVNGLPCTDTSRKVNAGHKVEIRVPELREAVPQPEDIPLDILFEDEHMLVINKPAGLVVHPGAGNWSGTLVNALLHHCGDTLSGIGGVVRPGIVHRLDKDTSGLMVVAKHDRAHQGLSAQLEDRSLSRIYEALVVKVPVPIKGSVDMPIGRDGRNRLKMSAKGQSLKEARTHYLVLENYREAFSLVQCSLESGRTHQIRVHMEAIKHPLIGDPLYGAQPTAVRAAVKNANFAPEIADILINFPRQALHAKSIRYIHPMTENEMEFEADRPSDFSKLLNLFDKK